MNSTICARDCDGDGYGDPDVDETLLVQDPTVMMMTLRSILSADPNLDCDPDNDVEDTGGDSGGAWT